MSENGFICPRCGDAVPDPNARSCPSCSRAFEPLPEYPDGASLGDLALFGLRAAAASIPVPLLGGFLGVTAQLIQGPLERKREAWLRDLWRRVSEIEGTLESFDLRSLVDNPVFASAVIRTIRAVDATNEQEKLDALQDFLVGSISSGPEEGRRDMYMNLIEQLSVTELRIIKRIRRFSEASTSNRLRGDALPGGTGEYAIVPLDVLSEAMAEGSDDVAFIDQVLDNLQRMGLLFRMPGDSGRSSTGMGPGGPLRCRHLELRPISSELLDFIDPLSPESEAVRQTGR